jgi:hypothetical protein
VEEVSLLADTLGCGIASLPVRYLGLPLGASYKAKHICDDIIEKIDYWLASWKRRYLSKGGGLLSSRVLYLIYLHIICLFSPSQ